ncbi:hypothetical protein DFH09DRAFT_1081212 [Mycena vulgaris]|nr:hypothetical protein DFH09DRAFT_1081212 [Mycena vulgaris]
MGRELFTTVLNKQRELYRIWIERPHSIAGEEFHAPTTDPFVACARHMIEFGNTQRAVSELPTEATSLLGFPILFTTGSSSPTMPDFAPITPPLVVPPISRAVRQPLMHRADHELAEVVNPINGVFDPFTLHNLNVPVALVDSVSHTFTQTPQFAVLGPHLVGMLWGGRTICLSNGDLHTVTIRRNHGTSPLKPWCTVIETEYEVAGLLFPRILLAANFLVSPEFIEEENPNPQYTGDGAAVTLHDWMGFPFFGPTYGISAINYRRADSPDGSLENYR